VNALTAALALAWSLVWPQDGHRSYGVSLERFTTVTTGDQGGSAKPGARVVHNAGEWLALRRDLGISDEQASAWKASRGPLSGLDWGRDQLVLVSGGERQSGGFTVEVSSVRVLQSGNWRVDAEVTGPKPDEMSIQALTRPWALVRTRRFAGRPFVFVKDK
jgi:hypothetical protein